MQSPTYRVPAELIGSRSLAYPADYIDEMQARFMAHGTRSPFSWANRLRMYGKWEESQGLDHVFEIQF